MVRDTERSFYLYRLTWQERSQTGLVSVTSVDEYNDGIIKKHEHTRPVKVNDRADHIDYLQAQVGPVFSTFRANDELRSLFESIMLNKPDTAFKADDNVKHELWVVSDQATVQKIIDTFAKLDALYIADGHHRSQAASEILRRRREENPSFGADEPANYFLNVLFADDELRILPYNRVVKDLNGHTVDELMKLAEEKFVVNKTDVPVDPEILHSFGVYADGQWYLLGAKDGTFDANHPTKSIDASVLADNFIAPLLGIDDPKTDNRIEFIGGIRGVEELVRLVDSGKFKIAFSLYPTSIEQLLNVADAGEVMPPKSTWFEPKLRSGMVVNLLTE
jgi:uncharacterized protein (DUF1015 family)